MAVENRILRIGGENQIQDILDALPFYVLLIDSEHKIVAVNKKITEDFKVSPQELNGVSCPIVLHGSKTPVAECPLVEALDKGGAAERELFDSANEQWIRAAVFPTPLVTDSGKPVYLHFARDITEIKRTEKNLSQSLEHHSALCDLLQALQYCQTSDQIRSSDHGILAHYSDIKLNLTLWHDAEGFLRRFSPLLLVPCSKRWPKPT